MSEKLKARKRVLFVDDDQAFLEMVESLFGLWSKNTWEIHLAHNTGKALSIMQQTPVDLVIIDLHMPVVDGLQFLRLIHRKYPNLPKAVLTSSEDPKNRENCLNSGAELYLQKPAAINDLESVYAALNEVVELQTQEGFRGVLRRVGLQEVLQLECLGGKSSILEIVTEGMAGRIFIKQGSIVHAHVGQRKGEAAFNYLMAINSGEFALKPFEEPPEETIQGQWEMLVMEAARLRDEVGGPNFDEPVTQVVPEAPAEKPAATFVAPLPPDPTRIKKAVSRKQSAPPSLPHPQTDEMLVCSAQGDVLYEWQCTESEARIKFLELVRQKTQQMAMSVPLGNFERLDVQLPNSHLQIKVQKDCAVMVRSSNSTPESVG